MAIPPIAKVALVTAGARRLGRQIALELAANGWGVAVHFHSSADAARETVAAIQALGMPAHAFGADLTDEDLCNALLPAVLAQMGRVDAVVNNAALFEHDDVMSFNVAAMEQHWRANTAPAVILSRALYQALSGSGRSGAVVNLLDQKLFNPNPDHLSYTLSKAALQCATTLLAQALAPIVRVNAVAPGLTLGSDDIDGARLAALQAATPLQRGVAPADVARAVRFLLENESATGTTLIVDAGSHLAPAARDFAFQEPPRAERRAAPSRPAVPSGAEPGHEQSGGLLVPGERLGHMAQRGLQDRPTYPSNEGLQ